MRSWISGVRIGLAPALGALVLVAALPAAAPAQHLFDFLFGRTPPPAPPPGRAYAPADRDPFRFPPRARERNPSAPPTSGGTTMRYCVRLCDGRFFPLASTARATPAELCRALCPASPTRVFTGSAIETATADGRSYAGLPNAFRYRTSLVSGCTCNGTDPLGLARIDPEDDPTLAPGDIVAVDGGLKAYAGGQRRRRTADGFTPLRGHPSLSRRERSALERVPVTSGGR